MRLRCCEHNPCPTRPTNTTGRYLNHSWVCPDCGQEWREFRIRPEYRYWPVYKWKKVDE